MGGGRTYWNVSRPNSGSGGSGARRECPPPRALSPAFPRAARSERTLLLLPGSGSPRALWGKRVLGAPSCSSVHIVLCAQVLMSASGTTRQSRQDRALGGTLRVMKTPFPLLRFPRNFLHSRFTSAVLAAGELHLSCEVTFFLTLTYFARRSRLSLSSWLTVRAVFSRERTFNVVWRRFGHLPSRGGGRWAQTRDAHKCPSRHRTPGPHGKEFFGLKGQQCCGQGRCLKQQHR